MIIEILGTEIKMPTSINQLTRSQIVYLAEMLLEDLDAETISILMFKKIIDNYSLSIRMKIFYHLNLKNLWIQTPIANFIHNVLGIDIVVYKAFSFHNVEIIIRCMSFLFEKDALYIQKIPYFYEKQKKFIGPKDFGVGLSFGQFWNTELAFLQYSDSPTSSNFFEIIENLYTPTTFNPLKRHGLSAAEKEVIIWYWQAVREGLFMEFPFVFSSKKQTKELINIEEYQDNWLDVLDTIAEKPDKYETINSLPVRDVLRHINKRIKETKELEEKLKK